MSKNKPGYYHIIMLWHTPSRQIITSEKVKGMTDYIGSIFQYCQAICEVGNPYDYELILFPAARHYKDGREYCKQGRLTGEDIKKFAEAANQSEHANESVESSRV